MTKRNEKRDGLEVLRTVLRRLRCDDQGGYPGLHRGKWGFLSTSLPQTTPMELDALFRLAGIVPDEIVPKGHCEDCVHSDGDGREQGYVNPCSPCGRPGMTNFVPVSALARKGLPLTDDERAMLGNYQDARWWATGFFDPEEFTNTIAWRAAASLKARLLKRGLLFNAYGGTLRLSRIGHFALKSRSDCAA